MKAVLVIGEMPKECRRCQLMVDRFCYGIPMDEVHDNININERPSWCPLRVLPEKIDHLSQLPDDIKKWSFVSYETFGYEEGWNACLDEITGENHEEPNL